MNSKWSERRPESPLGAFLVEISAPFFPEGVFSCLGPSFSPSAPPPVCYGERLFCWFFSGEVRWSFVLGDSNGGSVGVPSI